jgi:hypothetical protein
MHLSCTRAFTAVLIACEHFKLDIQHGFAVIERTALSVKGGEGALGRRVA